MEQNDPRNVWWNVFTFDLVQDYVPLSSYILETRKPSESEALIMSVFAVAENS